MLLFLYSMNEANHFVLIAAPGSGKGTFSQYFVENYDYVHICPGDIFRAEILAGTQLGKQIQPVVQRGDYVSEPIVCELVAKKLDHVLLLNKKFILDGFPRSIESFDFLHDYLTKHNLVEHVVFVQLQTEDCICKERVLTRRICKNCSRVYNIIWAKPLVPTVCDICYGDLSLREGDTLDIITKRLIYFHEHIQVLFDKAKEIYSTYEINTNQLIEHVREEYEKLVV